MAYLSYYRPLLRELGQGHAFLWGSRSVWGIEPFFHGTLRDMWGRKMERGFGDTDVHETQSRITITSDMPGVRKEDIRVCCFGDILSVQGKRNPPVKLVDDIFGSMERGYGSMSRNIRLPPHTDYSKIIAKYENGVLSISIMKPDTEKDAATEVPIPIQSVVCFIKDILEKGGLRNVYKSEEACTSRLQVLPAKSSFWYHLSNS